MVYQLIEKMKFDELKGILRFREFRLSGEKSELVARVFIATKQQTTGGGSRFFPVILVPSLFSASFSFTPIILPVKRCILFEKYSSGG